jgi:hypothetical protein
MAPSTTPVTPAQNNLLQPSFEAAFGTTPSTSSSSSFDPSGEAPAVQTLFLLLIMAFTSQGQCDYRKLCRQTLLSLVGGSQPTAQIQFPRTSLVALRITSCPFSFCF